VKPFIIAYVSVTVAFLALDGLWLGLIAKHFYAQQLGDLMRRDFLVLPAILFYLIYSAGLVWFAVLPVVSGSSLLVVSLNGAFLGLIAYGTYNMTNLATLNNWPTFMTAVDLTWGTVMSGLIALFAASVVRHFV